VNTPTNAMSDPGLESRAVASATPSATSPLYWSVRRELWEHRSIWMAPLAVAAVFLLGFAISAGRLPARMRTASALEPMQQRAAIAGPYCLDALYGERRDRATLFWKSLPVSDRTTVLAKASIPLLVLPLLAFALAVAVQSTMLVLHSAALAASGQDVGALWSQIAMFRRSLFLLYHLMAVHSLSHAPFYAWMLLVSAWAPRAPVLWAFLPPMALCFLERLAFNTTHLLSLLWYCLAGGTAAMPMSGMLPTDPMTHLTPGLFLISPGLWLGLAVTALFLAGAVRLRRSRGPI
jgi:ABC-2 type transport system permease protein